MYTNSDDNRYQSNRSVLIVGGIDFICFKWENINRKGYHYYFSVSNNDSNAGYPIFVH